jgi:phosphohistidine phosphatase SixA
LETADALRNETPRDDFERWLAHLKTANHVLLVGHAPTLAERAARLLGFSNPDALSLPKAGLICAETFDGRGGRLVLFVSPEWLSAHPVTRLPPSAEHGSPKIL